MSSHALSHFMLEVEIVQYSSIPVMTTISPSSRALGLMIRLLIFPGTDRSYSVPIPVSFFSYFGAHSWPILIQLESAVTG